MMTVEPYTAELAPAWNEFVGRARNATFLLRRDFMDYHADRFRDCSLVVRKRGKICGVLPANLEHATQTVWTHQGLTYGGLLIGDDCGAEDTLTAFGLITEHYQAQGARAMIYKPVPSIYHRYPADEPLYALFRHGATLTARGISAAIDLRQPLAVTESRRSGLRKAARTSLTVERRADEESIAQFHTILTDVLATRHHTQPVHSADEIARLMRRFPHDISLFTAIGTTGETLAGAWVFDCGPTVHTQYLAATSAGRQCGALDAVIAAVIRSAATGHAYLDFGVSTEAGGTVLNSGLAFQKEGFGARGVAYDTYRLTLGD